MATIRGYIASTIDGYIATPDGRVDFLKPFEKYDYDFASFSAEIGTVVMGRNTFEQSLDISGGWFFAGKRALILSSKAHDALPEGVSIWRDGLDALVSHLRALDDGDAWIVGGAALQLEFLRRGALDRLEWTIVPVLLGIGLPLFPLHDIETPVRLAAIRELPGGMVQIDYRFGDQAAS